MQVLGLVFFGGPTTTATFCTSGPCVVQWPTSFIQDMVYYSENQEAKHAANALFANRAAVTQNMSIVHLKTKVSRSTHGTEQNELKSAPPK